MIDRWDNGQAADFFAQAQNALAACDFDNAINLYLQGLKVERENVEAHRAHRQVSFQRKSAGGHDLGLMDVWKLSWTWRRSDRQNLLNAERLLAYDPGNMDKMLTVYQAASAGGFFDTAEWISEVLPRANAASPRAWPS